MSIRNRLLLYTLSILIGFMMLNGIINYVSVQRVVVDLSQEKASAMAESSTNAIATYLLQKGSYAWSIAQDEQVHQFARSRTDRYEDLSNDYSYQQMLTTFRRISASNPDINEAYIAVTKTQRIYDIMEFTNPPDYFVSDRPWYTNAVKNRGLTFSPPYKCPVTGKDVITASIPFYDSDGSLLGVACVDIRVDKMKDTVNGVHLFNSGYAFLVDQTGNIISYPGKNNQPTSFKKFFGSEMKSLQSSMLLGKQGMEKVTLHGEENYIFYSPVPDVKWSLGIVVPANEILKPINLLGKLWFMTLILAILVSSIMVIVFTGQITRPINLFKDMMKKVEEGDYTVRSALETGDEMETLGNSINTMLDKQMHLINEVTDIAYKMGVAGHDLAILVAEGRATQPLYARCFPRIVNLGDEIREDVDEALAVKKPKIANSLLESIIELNHLLRQVTDLTQEIDSLANKQKSNLPAVNNITDTMTSEWERIGETVIEATRLSENIEMVYLDLIEIMDDGADKANNILNLWQVLQDQLREFSGARGQLMDQAGHICDELVRWSKELVELSSDFKNKG